MPTAISTIRNLGPAVQDACADAGITSAEQLREIGADAAYAAMLRSGTKPHFIGFYVLHMALQGRPWNDCKGAEKAALRVKFDKIKADNTSLDDTGIDAALAQIGVIKKSARA